MNMTVREFFTNVYVVDNAVFVEKLGNELFSIIRNYNRITIDMIPEEILDRKIQCICGASTKYKIAIWLK